jgi:hypothetical protein
MDQKDTIHLAQEFLGRMGSFFFVFDVPCHVPGLPV